MRVADSIPPSVFVLVSPCDAIPAVLAAQIRRHPALTRPRDFLTRPLLERDLVEAHRDPCYVTLRLTASMYHRFTHNYVGRVERVVYVSGDTWNVNPIALRLGLNWPSWKKPRHREHPALVPTATHRGRRHLVVQHRPSPSGRAALTLPVIAAPTSSPAMRATARARS